MNAPRNPELGGSLIERAADAYGLNDFARRPVRVPLDAPEVPPAFVEPRIHLAPPAPIQAPLMVPVSSPISIEDTKPAPVPVIEAQTPAPPLETNEEQVVAHVPPLYTDAAAIDRGLLTDAGMIVPGATIGVLAEEFRLVKRQLLLTARQLRDDPAKARTILICSARPDEGKTFCAINLAISLAAERETEVLLIDGDFAKRDLMPRMGLTNGPGFLDALDDPALDPENLVIRTDIPQLSLLAAGNRANDDTELLASDRTRQVIGRLLAADARRLLLFDSPPALAASPASVFALHAGQVMMVVRADATSDTEIRDAVALLDGCPTIQLVLNQVRHQSGGYRFGDYYTPVEDSK